MASRDTLTGGNTRDRERAIDETRRDLAGTMNEIENRLSPGRLRAKAREVTVGRAESMARNVRERAQESSRSAIDTIRDNPIPAAMVGLGLAWLLMNRRAGVETSTSRRLGSRERAWEREAFDGERRGVSNGGTVERATEYGREKIEQVKEGAGEAMGRIREKSESLGREARRQASTVEERFESIMHDNPLGVGVAALGIGFAIGLALPRTEKEDELFGSARDRLVESTRRKALGAIEKGEEELNTAAERAVSSSEGQKSEGQPSEQR